MTKILIVFISTLSFAGFGQDCYMDSLVKLLKNDSIQSIASNPFFLGRDSLGAIADRRAVVFSMDKDYLNVYNLGKDATPYLLEHLIDEDKDYVINMLLYSIYKVDASPIIAYASISKIKDWKKYQKKYDFIFWQQKFGVPLGY